MVLETSVHYRARCNIWRSRARIFISRRCPYGYWVHTLQFVFEELEALGLSKPAPKPEAKKRGRKPKPKNETVQKPKRPRGRPRKNSNPSAGTV